VFEVEVRWAGEQMILDLRGPLGREGGEMILQTVQDRPALPRRLVFNFTRVGQMNTAGLGGVLWVVRLVTRAGGQVSAYGLSDHFRKVFHVMGLTQFIRVVADEAAALE
jgi:anti-anti-sigma regulatory factor